MKTPPLTPQSSKTGLRTSHSGRGRSGLIHIPSIAPTSGLEAVCGGGLRNRGHYGVCPGSIVSVRSETAHGNIGASLSESYLLGGGCGTDVDFIIAVLPGRDEYRVVSGGNSERVFVAIAFILALLFYPVSRLGFDGLIYRMGGSDTWSSSLFCPWTCQYNSPVTTISKMETARAPVSAKI